jgi:hypothetical protein
MWLSLWTVPSHVTLYRHEREAPAAVWCTFCFGPRPARYYMEKRCEMMTILIILLVLFLLGGGGWGYSRWRG